MAKKVLIIVDVQNDFCPGGALHKLILYDPYYRNVFIVSKGMNDGEDAYSGFKGSFGCLYLRPCHRLLRQGDGA